MDDGEFSRWKFSSSIWRLISAAIARKAASYFSSCGFMQLFYSRQSHAALKSIAGKYHLISSSREQVEIDLQQSEAFVIFVKLSPAHRARRFFGTISQDWPVGMAGIVPVREIVMRPRRVC